MAQHVLSIGMSHSTAAATPRPDGYIVLLDEIGPRIVADVLFISSTSIDMKRVL